MKRALFFLTVLCFLLAACGSPATPVAPPAATATVAMAATSVPAPTTALSATATPPPTVAPSTTPSPAASPTATTTRTPLPPSPTATLAPLPPSVTFHYDDGVPADQRQRIENGVTFAHQFFGDIGPLSVYAYANLDALINEYSRLWGRAPTSSASAQRRDDFQNHIHPAFLDGVGMWIWVDDVFKAYSISHAWQLMVHEYVHGTQRVQSKLPKDKLIGDANPEWFFEGSAEYESYRALATLGMEDMLVVQKDRINRSRGILNPLSSMETYAQAIQEDQSAHYMFGFLANEFLVKTVGDDAVVTKYWQARATTSTWQDAFKAAFGVSVDDFYSKFEEYRRTQFPPSCGTLVTGNVAPTPAPFGIKFDRQFAPGALSFSESAYSQPPNIPYTFCVTGFPLVSLTATQKSAALKWPPNWAGYASCGGNCVILYMRPTFAAGTYTVGIQLPDGRRAETTFEHKP